LLRTSTENEKRSAKKNVTEPMKNRGTRRMKSGVPKSGTWLMRSALHMKRGTWSFGEFQMNIFARTLDVSTTLPLAA
jgi:hypothetical protein